MTKRAKNNLLHDAIFIAISIFVAVILERTGAFETILRQTQSFWFLDSFIAGMFFTSIFTTAPAIVALGEIAQHSQSVIPIMLFGGVGALCGDIIIFRFVRDRVGKDIMALMATSGRVRVRHIFHLKLFRWITFFFGAVVIASPLPDELGLAMMGLSKANTSLFVPTSLIANSLGILAISLLAKNLGG
jgi:hypothetical protein